jgi:glycosyltransferase involved in cell wall biosynthesis
MTAWMLLTGEYPPVPGGVADYTRQVARALAGAGDVVDVWSPRAPEHERDFTHDAGVTVHALPDHFGPRSLRALSGEIGRRPGARVFVQYVPHALGMRGMNVPFCVWLAAQRAPMWVLFHEMTFPFRAGAPLKHNVLAVMHHAMAAISSRGADRTFVTVPGWNVVLKRALGREGEWLPVASNAPTEVSADAAARTRASLGFTSEQLVLGHFGTFTASITQHLAPVFRALLAGDPRRVALLIGRGGQEFAARELGDLGTRVVATGALDAAYGSLDAHVLAAHLASSDLVVQPYSDGVSSRRTTAMAALALGKPLLTNQGFLTEPCWRDGDVALATDPSAESLLAASNPFLGDPVQRADLARRGLALYQRAFSLERLVRALRETS